MIIKLLIVDDEKEVVQFFRRYFEVRPGFIIVTATSDEEAIEFVKNEKFDLMFLDIKLKGSQMNGLEVLRRTKELSPQTKVIMITADEDRSSIEEASKLGASGYLTKPIELLDLDSKITAMVGRLFKILVVDDDQIVLKSLDKALRKKGYEVTSTNDPDQAVDEIKKSDFDLIIADMRMPKKYGVQLIEEIRSILDMEGRKKIPEFFVTAYANDETLKAAEKLKVAEFISKPFDLKKFLELVHTHLKK